MSSDVVLERLRRFLLLFAAATCVGILIELLAEEHTQEPLQWVPFVLCGLALVAILAALIRPQRGVLLALRAIMVLLVLGSLLGIYEHVTGNAAFALEIRPNLASGDLLVKALTGANPLLAPGALAVAGTLALAATYAHPALRKVVLRPA